MKGSTMFKIEEQFKKFEEVTEQVKQANEFWINAILSSMKSFYKVK
jgi:hypothetical protein